MKKPAIRYALLSTYDKTGLLELVYELQRQNIALIATGGTADLLKTNGIAYIPIEEITHNPESFDGRMKTLSFQVMSGILFDRHNRSHVDEKKSLDIVSIDYVVCNFYPFWKKPGIEMIDIGGPTMVRAAAKNFSSVTVLTNPTDYPSVIAQLKKTGESTLSLREKLSAKAFTYVSWYDGIINNYFAIKTGSIQRSVNLINGKMLRYGENPHQKGIFYNDNMDDPLGLGNFIPVQGKEISYNNYLDLDAGVQAMSLIGLKKPAVVILKHTNPCGAAIADSISDAFQKAWFEGDPLAAFGGVILMNRPVDKSLAMQMLSEKKFFEILAAPDYSKEALEIFSQKPRLQILKNPNLSQPIQVSFEDIKKVRGGYLLQDSDFNRLTKNKLKTVTKKKPSPKQINDLLFAWNLCFVSKSNCVVVAKDEIMLSSGVGQQDRKRCCELCVQKSIKPLKGAVAATDGFFPFRDGPDVLIESGIDAIIQPGGSIRDKETIDACNEKGISMVFTSVRAFKH